MRRALFFSARHSSTACVGRHSAISSAHSRFQLSGVPFMFLHLVIYHFPFFSFRYRTHVSFKHPPPTSSYLAVRFCEARRQRTLCPPPLDSVPPYHQKPVLAVPFRLWAHINKLKIRKLNWKRYQQRIFRQNLAQRYEEKFLVLNGFLTTGYLTWLNQSSQNLLLGDSRGDCPQIGLTL